MRKQAHRIPPLFLVLACFGIRPAPAQLVPILNPSFDTSVAGWSQEPPASSSWAPSADADGCPGGAARLWNNVDQLIELRQCVPISGTGPLTVLTRARVSIPPGTVVLRAEFYSDPACNEFLLENETSSINPSWTTLRLDFSSIPAGTDSIRIALQAEGAVPVADGHFDEVRVARAALLFADGFEASSPCRWSFVGP